MDDQGSIILIAYNFNFLSLESLKESIENKVSENDREYTPLGGTGLDQDLFGMSL